MGVGEGVCGGAGGDGVPVGVQIVNLAEGWDVMVEVARRMVWEYGAVQGMGYADVVREIGTS